MAPISPDNTPRFRIKYSVTGHDHDFQIRSTNSPSAIGAFVDSFLTPLISLLYGVTITSVEHAATGSNVFLPVTSGIEGNVYGGPGGSIGEVPWNIDFAGRSAGGRKWRLAVFGMKSLAGDYKFLPGENTPVDNAIAALQTRSPGDLLGIDATEVTVYSYANAGVNAHWQRALRP